MRYCILLSVINTDTKTALRNIAADLSAYFIPRDVDNGVPQRYVWGVNSVPLTYVNPKGQTQEIEAAGMIGFNQDLSKNVLIELDRIQKMASLVQQLSFNPSLNRVEIEARLETESGYLGCDKHWIVKPGDNVTVQNNAGLLAKFG